MGVPEGNFLPKLCFIYSFDKQNSIPELKAILLLGEGIHSFYITVCQRIGMWSLPSWRSQSGRRPVISTAHDGGLAWGPKTCRMTQN
jgi:hypothetical protein